MTLQTFVSTFAAVLLTTAQALGSAAAPSESAVTKSVHQHMARISGPNGAFCYASEDAPIQGFNVDKPVRIASVMKLLTTFWAIETKGADSRFETQITIQRSNKEVHISGVRDPYFDRFRLGLLLADLNRLGITEINRLTVDSNFWIDYGMLDFLQFHPNAWITTHAGTSLAAQNIKQKIEDGFNTANWSKSTAALYAGRARSSSSPKLPEKVEMKVDQIDIVDENPLAGKPDVETFVLRSAPLKMYIREMNIFSANPMADELFASMGGVSAFQKFMAQRFGATFNFGGVNSGSGLPVTVNHVRKDTEVTCRTVVSLVRRLDHDLEKQGHDLTDIMAILGKDQGYFSDDSKAVIAKTGTVDGAKNLAGAVNSTDGEIYFGIFLQGKGSNKGNLRTTLTKFRMNFKPKAVEASALHFRPLDPAMQLTPVTRASAPSLRKP